MEKLALSFHGQEGVHRVANVSFRRHCYGAL